MVAKRKFDLTELFLKRDAEAPLYRFECLIDTIAKIADGLPEDRTTQNALNGIHEALRALHTEFEQRLL